MTTSVPTLLLWLDEAVEIEHALAEHIPAGALRILRAKAGDMPSPDALATADIVFAWDMPSGAISGMPRLKWIQAATGGVENWTKRGDLVPGVTLTCARGVHRVQMPENILGALFHVTKSFPECRAQQERHDWKRLTFDLLAGKTLGIVGLGAIGSELARKAAALEMRVVGARKTPGPVPAVEHVYGLDEIEILLGQSDYVVLLIPVTPDTNNLMNAHRLAAMKPGAWLLNFARGEHVVDADLIRALRKGIIAGAVLDAFREEPLPAAHPFWDEDRILLLPHVGGRHPQKAQVLGEMLAGNVKRYLAGEPLQGVVDPATGY
jgi:glyoxylate/hydroxypyruvate reductase A